MSSYAALPPRPYKRKRSSAATALMVYRPYKSPYKKRRTFVPGRDRVGGYYGRFSGRGGELKFLDSTIVDAIVATAGSIEDSINLVAQGVTESERIGRKCVLKSVSWRYKVDLPEQDAQGTPGAGDTLRIIMFLDKQANGATAAITDVLETATHQSFYNLANQNRFSILCDKLHNINYAGLASDGAGVVSQALVIQNKTFYKKLDLPIEFSGTTGAITEIRSNNIGVILISDRGVCGFSSQIRIRFADS